MSVRKKIYKIDDEFDGPQFFLPENFEGLLAETRARVSALDDPGDSVEISVHFATESEVAEWERERENCW